MRLFHFPLSPFSAKVRMALYEKGLSFETVEIPTAKSGILEKPPELFEINPRGEVPALVDDDVRLYDSTVILEYLEDRYPDPRLYPKDVVERARARQLEDAGDEVFLAGCTPLVEEVWRKPAESERDTARVAAAFGVLERFYARLEAALEGREYLCAAFGVADIACFIPTLMASTLGAAPDPALERVVAWQARVAERPAVSRDVADMLKDAARLG